ncbi:MAG: hypothetical protein KF689_02865 [Gemmatimonadaceae bacterium]|nr:hypothetical protein [Gemmatimonadaceae bacterium]MCW5827587.1 hypothetical protein [Gemmatimonadaceae bacterium]
MSKLSILLVSLASVAISCDSPTGVDRELVVQLDPTWVGGESSSRVDWSTRQFILPGNVMATLPIARAESIATALSAMLAADAIVGNIRETLEADRGGQISFNDLTPCRRLTYTISPANAETPGLSLYQRRSLASQWAVPLCSSRGDAIISVSIADAPFSGQISEEGITWDSEESASGAFRLTGMRPTYPSGLPLSPEEAAKFLYMQLGTRIIRGPDLVSQYEETNIARSAHCGSWRFVIETSLDVSVADGGSVTRDAFYLRRHPSCISDQIAVFVERDSQPTTFWSYRLVGSQLDSVLVQLNLPTRFTRVLF